MRIIAFSFFGRPVYEGYGRKIFLAALVAAPVLLIAGRFFVS
jgi:hypothetical protein